MTLEEAIKTAITYETRIRDLYRSAAAATGDPVAAGVYGALADDEQHHVAYLEDRLKQWEKNGSITPEALGSTLPDIRRIAAEMGKIRDELEREDRTDEKQMLSKALHAELETSRFYEQMVQELTGDAQMMFQRFLEIENEHIEIVQAELDFVSRTGYWFDIKEFDME